jgi:hypothetical protein
MVTAPGSPTPPTAHPPPPLPNDPSVSSVMSNYLQQFSRWCRQGFAAKLNSNVALEGILLQANDAPAGTVPAVWLLQVQTNGTFVATPVPLAGGNPTR